MPDLNVSLAKHIDPESFEAYLPKLDPLVISKSFRSCIKNKTMYRAWRAWAVLGKDLSRVNLNFINHFLRLLDSQSGISIDAMRDTITPWLSWFEDTAQALTQIAECVDSAEYAFHETAKLTIKPEWILENRAKANRIAAGPILTQKAELDKLDDQYERWRDRNIAAMRQYRREIAEIVATLPTFPEPPLCR